MAVSNTHPFYDENKDDWQICRDAFMGQKAVKKRGTVYLPKPGGFLAMNDSGEQAYEDYKKRAQFPEIFAPTVRGIVGTIHGAEWQIELPPALDSLFEKATPDGLSLELLSRRITSEILVAGRFGLLADAPMEGGDPYISTYRAETIINWDEDYSLFVLNESDYYRTNFIWAYENRWRVLMLEGGRYVQQLHDTSGPTDEDISPSARGGRALTEIPFVVVGSKDLTAEVEEPPLIGVARAALAYYRLDADYRHQLYNSGQETLFIINAEPPDYVGSGVVHAITAPEGVEVDAKYVGPSGKTIEAHRQARLDELHRAADSGARVFAEDGGANESGEARRLRYSSETANIKTIAMSSAAGLKKALQHAALIAGANPDDVIVEPPKKMLEPVMTGQEALQLVQAWQTGGMSYQTLYENLQRGQIASMDRDAEEEMRLLDAGEFEASTDTI